MFYEHVSRQSSVDTSKHRRGRDLLLQQISFSFHHMSSPVADFGHTLVPHPLLSCVSFSSLLSLPPCRCPPQSKPQPSALGNPRAFPAPRAPGSPETPETHQGDHADFSVMHRKQIAIFWKEMSQLL